MVAHFDICTGSCVPESLQADSTRDIYKVYWVPELIGMVAFVTVPGGMIGQRHHLSSWHRVPSLMEVRSLPI